MPQNFRATWEKQMKTPWGFHGISCKILQGLYLQIGPSFIMHENPWNFHAMWTKHCAQKTIKVDLHCTYSPQKTDIITGIILPTNICNMLVGNIQIFKITFI